MIRTCMACVLAAGLAASASAATVTVSPLVMAGDGYGAGIIDTGFASVAGFAISNSGQWVVESALDFSLGDLLIGGTVPTLPGAVLVTDNTSVPSGGVINNFGRISMNNAGVLGYNANYGAPSSGVLYNITSEVLVVNTPSTAPQFSPGTLFLGFFGAVVNDTNQQLVMASVDDVAIASTVDRALVLITDPAGAATQSVLMKEGDEVVPGRLLVDFQTNPHTYTLAADGRVLCVPDMDGDTTTDTGLLYYNGTAWSFLAREGDPCPAVPGRNYGNFGTTPCDINNAGGWAARITLDNSSTTDDSVIIRNGTDVIAREGSPVHGVPGFNFSGFGTGAVHIDDSGDVYYYGTWTDTGTPGTDSALFRNSEILVRNGVTVASSGETVTDIAGVQDNFVISDNGRFLLFEGDLTDSFGFTRRGTILVQISGCPADFNDSGSVTVQDIFDFLGAYFAGNPSADFNGAGGVTVQDIFDFLAAYFTGCA